MSDNTRAMKRRRAYKALLMAILENASEEDLIDAASDYASSGNSLTVYQTNIQDALNRAKEDAKNFFPHYQRGCGIPILKTSPLGKKLSKGAFNPPNEEE